ncbi:hypothetical protein [Robertkochia sediminum]|uniref:hypothetical protein n=1 Tax=Robertkochia sediminum TaxID=2785326 RepID=UPI001931C427|nr:hypothetical protein [Robertkochia sediminum]MBL7474124.1 hypothetical protein [Robertkochia sediminum]
MIKTIQNDFVTLKFHDTYVIGIIHEGIDLETEQGAEIFNLCNQFYGDKPYAIISYRLNSYSFNPFMHQEVVNQQPNLISFAIAAHSPVQRMNFAIEKMFLKVPNGFFNNLQDAIAWTQKQVEKSPKRQASPKSH